MNRCPNCNYVLKDASFLPGRSNQQNRAFFGLAVERLAQQCSCSKETMYKALAGEFIGWDEVKIGEKAIKVPKSTKNLNTIQFNDFFEKIQRWAAENGIDIPNPNEN